MKWGCGVLETNPSNPATLVGLTVNRLRSRLTLEHVDMLIYLNKNASALRGSKQLRFDSLSLHLKLTVLAMLGLLILLLRND